MGIPWLVTTCSVYEPVDPNNTLCLSSTITLTNAFRLKSASKNCTLHFLASRTNSNFASPSARMALPPAGLQHLSKPLSLKRPHARGCTGIDCDLHDLAQQFHGKCLKLFPRCCDFVSSERLESIAFSPRAWWILLPLNSCTFSSS